MYTIKNKLADALENVLLRKSISKVTITDIVTESGVSRQTFYNNFLDIYDLLYWTHANRIEEAVNSFYTSNDYCLAFRMATDIMRKHKVFYRQIILKDGENSFQRQFALKNIELCKERILECSSPISNENLFFYLKLYWYGAAQVIVEWIMDDMQTEPAELAILLYNSLPHPLLPFWSTQETTE